MHLWRCSLIAWPFRGVERGGGYNLCASAPDSSTSPSQLVSPCVSAVVFLACLLAALLVRANGVAAIVLVVLVF